MRRSALVLCTCFLLFASATNNAFAADDSRPFLHPLFTDHMVLQRDVSAPVWGWTEAGAEVTVSLGDQSVTAKAGKGGKWSAKIGPFPAGGPHTLKVKGPKTVEVSDVLIGDVWLCSGQSNMQWSVAGSNNPQEEIAAAKWPKIRLFSVPRRVADEPQITVDASWAVCSPETIPGFTAVGYYFGRELHRALDVPIGLIHSSWGGTVAEAWTSARALQKMEDFAPVVKQFRQSVRARKQGGPSFEKALAKWWSQNDPGTKAAWSKPGTDTSSWKTMKLPVLWESAGLSDFDGVAWFQKTIDVPAAWAGKDLTLGLGPVDDIDTTWFNGKKVGGASSYNTPRNYKVPADLVKAGANTITVRVLDTGGGGGIYGNPAQMKLSGNGAALSLAGEWRYQASAPLAKMGPVPRRPGSSPNVVTVLYNGMIAPLLPYGIKGAIWYQGESNAGRAMQYRTLLPTMIGDWRARFKNRKFPFFIVQLANFMARVDDPVQPGWAELREAQLLTARKDPKTGLAVIIDIGEARDIHPRNKQDVGGRLALAARGIAYKEKIVYSGPEFTKMEVKGSEAHLHFDHVGSGLVAKPDGKLLSFAVAGADKKFVHAKAEIRGNAVVVSSPEVETPVAVRYAWANNPVASLYNKEGLPATPFRTDVE